MLTLAAESNSLYQGIRALFLEEALTMPYATSIGWAASMDSLERIHPADQHAAFDDGAAILIHRPDPKTISLLHWGAGSEYLTVEVASKSQAHLDNHLHWLRTRFPTPKPTDDSVRASFWAWRGNSPVEYGRRLGVPTWADIASNYPTKVAEEFSTLIDLELKDDLFGRLILLHGIPGTGKTYAIRSLMQAWRNDASFHIITDPEEFFSRPSYMLEALLGGGNGWKLLIIEDNSEVLTVDARERVGQQLSRLLNLTDGLIGQGLRFLVLITTNDDIGRVHDALRRPGRSLASVGFTEFGPQEAAGWLASHGMEVPPIKALTLANCYSLLHGGKTFAAHSQWGF